MNRLFNFIAKVSSFYRSSQFICRKAIGDHVPGEGVGVAAVFRQPVLLQRAPDVEVHGARLSELAQHVEIDGDRCLSHVLEKPVC